MGKRTGDELDHILGDISKLETAVDTLAVSGQIIVMSGQN